MTSFYDSHDYYKKMFELQEKLRKSEEERIRLEERFKILAQESRNRHDACINRLRLRYIEFLEERRARDERNHKVFQALDKVDNSLASMTAKTDRLNVLRKQYEAYLRQIYKVSNASESTVRDSNVLKQSEDTYSVKDVATGQIALSSSGKSSSPQRMFPLNDPVNRTLSPAMPKFTQLPYDDYYFSHCQGIVVQPISLNQRTNERQNVYQNCSVAPDDASKQLSTHSPSSRSFQRKQLYNQPDKDLHVSYLSFSRPSSLGQQNVPHSNEPSLKRTEIAPTVSQIALPEYTGIPRYKFSDVSSNRFIPHTIQHYVEPSPTVQSVQEGNDRMVTGTAQRQAKITMRISPVGTMSRTPEWNTCGTSPLNKSFNLPRKSVPSYFSPPPPRKSDYYLRKSVGQPPAHQLTTSDDTIKRHKSFTQKSLGSPRLSTDMEKATAEEEERRTALLVENELDRYIDKIRKLHRDLDAQSLEENDQGRNTGGHDLNASQLNNNSHPSVEDSQIENLPKDVEKVLALANDLASRAVELNTANESGKGLIDRNRNVGPVDDTWNDTPVLERNNSAFSTTSEGRQTTFAKDRISNDIKLHEPKLDSLENIVKPREQSLPGLCDVLEQRERELPKIQADKRANFDASPDNVATEQKDIENVPLEELQRKDTCVAQESNLGQYSFDVAEELEPWDLDALQKRIKEIDLIDEFEKQAGAEEIIVDASKLYQDNAEVVEFSSEKDNLKNTEAGQDSKDDASEKEPDSKDGNAEYFTREEALTDKSVAETNDISVPRRSTVECEGKDGNVTRNAESEEHLIDERMEFCDEQREEHGEDNGTPDANNQVKIETQGEDYDEQNYYEDTNRAETYTENYETEYTGANEEYNYEQNAPYEGNPDQNYDPIVPYETEREEGYEQRADYEANQDENYEENVAYETNRNEDYDESVAYEQAVQNEGYGEYMGEQYVQESDEQYAEYVGEQYDSENRYEHDPNAQYQKDSNQQYAYTCDQQYDLNEVASAPVNQPIEYTDYDSNQAERKEEKEENDEHEEAEKESTHREEKEEPKINASQNNEEKISSENGPKKKKDVIKSLLDSDTDSTIERNVSNTESDFDFN